MAHMTTPDLADGVAQDSTRSQPHAPDSSLARWYLTTEWFSYRGHRVVAQHHRAAHGEATLVIHGFPTASWDWHAIWPTLQTLGPLVAPDMIGFGYSAKPRDYRYSIRDQAQLCLSLCRELGINRVHLLAHDYGDSVAQELLSLAPPELEILSAYLLNGGIIPDQHRPRPVQRLLIGPLGPLVARLMSRKRFYRSFAEVFGPDTQPSEAELAACWQLIEQHGGRRVMAAISQYIRERAEHGERWINAVRDASCPVGALIGELDPVSGAHLADALEQECPNVQLTRDPTIGHYPQLEAPESVSRCYLRFRTGDG